MTTTSLPTTALAVRPVEIIPDVEIEVHRSVRHLLICAGVLATAVTAGSGVSGLALNQYVELSKWLLVLAGFLAMCTFIALAEAYAREGRHWRYAEDLGPATIPEKG